MVGCQTGSQADRIVHYWITSTEGNFLQQDSHPRPKIISLLQAARYPQGYLWFVLVSALDLMMTWVVLHFGGQEVNALADHILQRWALTGMVIYKFALVAFVIAICEVVGYYRPRVGWALIWFGVFITFLPVILAFSHLIDSIYVKELPLPEATILDAPETTGD